MKENCFSFVLYLNSGKTDRKILLQCCSSYNTAFIGLHFSNFRRLFFGLNQDISVPSFWLYLNFKLFINAFDYRYGSPTIKGQNSLPTPFWFPQERCRAVSCNITNNHTFPR